MTHKLHVTERAIVRYLERVLHLDMDKIRDDIRAEVLAGRPCADPPIGGGVAVMGPRRKACCIVQNNSIVTVLGVKQIRRAKDWKWRGDYQ